MSECVLLPSSTHSHSAIPSSSAVGGVGGGGVCVVGGVGGGGGGGGSVGVGTGALPMRFSSSFQPWSPSS